MVEVSTQTSAVVREGCTGKDSGSRLELSSEASQESLGEKDEEGIRSLPTWIEAGKSLRQWWPSS